jgi:hypothetical protein
MPRYIWWQKGMCVPQMLLLMLLSDLMLGSIGKRLSSICAQARAHRVKQDKVVFVQQWAALYT